MSALREALAAAVEAQETPAPTDTPQAADAATPSPAPSPAPTPAPSSDDRVRDDSGRFVKALGGAPATRPAPAPAAAPIEPPDLPKYPSTWKPTLAAQWAALPPEVREEVLRRESDYAKGVSTYKKEWDNAAPILEALAPYQPMLSQNGVAPAQWIASLAEAQRTLAYGTPEQKLSMLRTVAQQYQIPLQNLFTQTAQGWQFNEQAMAPRPLGADDIRKLVQEESLNTWANSESKAFSEARDASGNPLHPHFDEVRGTMIGLLQSGLANDLPGAYAAALRLPAHSVLHDADLKSQADTRAREEATQRAAAALAAKGRAVGVKGGTPPAAAAASDKPKGLRAQLEAATDDVLGAGARV